MLDIEKMKEDGINQDLKKAISNLARVREGSKALKRGTYQEVFVDHQQFAFLREFDGEKVLVIVNASEKKVDLELDIDLGEGYILKDLLNPSDKFQANSQGVEVKDIPPKWGRVLKVEAF